MKNLLFLGLGLASTACSFSSPENAPSSKIAYAPKSEILQTKKDNKELEALTYKTSQVKRDNTYRNYFKCHETEFNYKYCFLDSAKIIDSNKDDLSFDYLVSYRFTCEKTRETAA